MVWGSWVRRYGELVKFCSDIKSDEALKATMVWNDSNQVMGDLSKSHSSGEVESFM